MVGVATLNYAYDFHDCKMYFRLIILFLLGFTKLARRDNAKTKQLGKTSTNKL